MRRSKPVLGGAKTLSRARQASVAGTPMYGFVHAIIKDFVLTHEGESKWSAIMREAGILGGDEATFLAGTHADSVTAGLLQAVVQTVGQPPADVLSGFGKHFVIYLIATGHASFLKAQGKTLPEFMGNLNNLHNILERDHPDAMFPFVEARFDEATNEMTLLYLSKRQGFATFFVGVVQELSKRLFGVEALCTPTEVPEDLKLANSHDSAAAWKVRLRPYAGGPDLVELAMDHSQQCFFTVHESIMACGRVLTNPQVLESHVWRADQMSVASRTKVVQLADLSGEDFTRNLMRGVRAELIAASWSDSTLRNCRQFWTCAVGRGVDYELSRDVQGSADVFVSHSWSAPSDWDKIMGKDVIHADFKSTTLAVMAKDLALEGGDLDSWANMTCWVDKACIPQDVPELKAKCIGLIEYFISRCQCVCVIFTWTYLERLWCVFEWACFLVEKEPNNIYLQIDFFIKKDTLPLYLDQVRLFCLGRTKCYHEGDRKILEDKIALYYKSTASFEQLVQFTAIAMVARSMAYHARHSTRLSQEFYQPWVELAQELGFATLANALGEWTAGTTKARRKTMLTVSDTEHARATQSVKDINDWFAARVTPVLRQRRQMAVKSVVQAEI